MAPVTGGENKTRSTQTQCRPEKATSRLSKESMKFLKSRNGYERVDDQRTLGACAHHGETCVRQLKRCNASGMPEKQAAQVSRTVSRWPRQGRQDGSMWRRSPSQSKEGSSRMVARASLASSGAGESVKNFPVLVPDCRCRPCDYNRERMRKGSRRKSFLAYPWWPGSYEC